MHNIEHTADGVKREMMTWLLKELLPPIEREEIMDLPNFRKSTALCEKIVAVNGLEEQGDRLEKCCDCCEHVADVVERVVMKNG